MRKVYKKLTKSQREKGIIFSSTLSKCRTEQPGDYTHYVYDTWDKDEQERVIKNLKDDSFFNGVPWWSYNIIRT